MRALLLALLLALSGCAATGGTRTPKTLAQAQRWAAQRAVERYYNPARCRRIFRNADKAHYH
jgi:hypothetical protein